MKLPTGWLAVKRMYYYYSGNQWVLCAEGTYHYNTVTIHQIEVKYTYQSKPCGTGSYYTRSLSYIWDDPNRYYSWYGGAKNSGQNWV